MKLQVEQQKAANQQKLQGLISQASVLCVIIPSVIPSIPIPGIVRVILVIGAMALGIYFYIKGTKTEESFVVKREKSMNDLKMIMFALNVAISLVLHLMKI